MRTEQELHDLRVRGMDCNYGFSDRLEYFIERESNLNQWWLFRTETWDGPRQPLFALDATKCGMDALPMLRAICYALNERYRLLHEPSPARDWTPPLGVRHAEEAAAQAEDDRLAREEAEQCDR